MTEREGISMSRGKGGADSRKGNFKSKVDSKRTGVYTLKEQKVPVVERNPIYKKTDVANVARIKDSPTDPKNQYQSYQYDVSQLTIPADKLDDEDRKQAEELIREQNAELRLRNRRLVHDLAKTENWNEVLNGKIDILENKLRELKKSNTNDNRDVERMENEGGHLIDKPKLKLTGNLSIEESSDFKNDIQTSIDIPQDPIQDL